MRTLGRGLFAVVVVVLPLLVLGALVLALEAEPRVALRDDVAPADVDRVVAIARLQDPRRAPLGQLRRLWLRERDLDLLVRYAAQRWLGARAQVQLQPQRLLVQASVPVPYGRWANIEFGLQQTRHLPAFEHLRVGRLPLPPSLALPLLRTLAAQQGLQADVWLASDAIERLEIERGRVVVSYRIGIDTADRLRAALLAPAEQQRLRIYADQLAGLTQSVEGGQVSLARLLPSLLLRAAERSAGGDEAAAEHRAALLTLAMFVTRRPLTQLVPDAETWPRARPLRVTLHGRHDLAQHFIVSAVIAAEAGTPLADAVGLWKELADARRGGSGFSFADLAADRAGTRLGELALRAPAQLQARLQERWTEADGETRLMPDVADLPENLPQSAFVARYGGVGGTGYNRLLAEIEARIDALPLYR